MRLSANIFQILLESTTLPPLTPPQLSIDRRPLYSDPSAPHTTSRKSSDKSAALDTLSPGSQNLAANLWDGTRQLVDFGAELDFEMLEYPAGLASTAVPSQSQFEYPELWTPDTFLEATHPQPSSALAESQGQTLT